MRHKCQPVSITTQGVLLAFESIRMALVGLALVASVPMAQAATVTFTNAGTFRGSDCSGVFGQDFENCAYNGSPIIAKSNTPFDVNDPVQTELDTSAFPGRQASWFTLTGTTWRHDPRGAGPGITALVARAGNEFTLFTMDAGPYFGGSQVSTFATPGNRDLSHISFHDTRSMVIPVPAALPLLLSGLVGLGLLARRQCETA
jgi:hypothetical protein